MAQVMKAQQIHPKPWQTFGLLLLIWGGFGLINFLMRFTNGIEGLEIGLVSMTLNLVVNVSFCFVMSFLFQRWVKVNQYFKRYMLAAVGLCVVVSVISTVVILALLGVYLHQRGIIPEFTFLIGSIAGNALIFFIIMMLWTLAYFLLTKMNQLKATEAHQQTTELALKQAQLNTLIGQLNPHFLFNGLNNIKALILEDASKARNMLTTLAELLRYGLNSERNEFVPLNDELEVVRNYINLAAIQYENRLDYQEKIQVQTENMGVPPMMIQLLVENGIRHGIDRSKKGGVLRLLIVEAGGMLTITVTNPGRLAAEHGAQSSTGLGLSNIKKRLGLLFDQQANFTIEQEPDEVKAIINLPVKVVL